MIDFPAALENLMMAQQPTVKATKEIFGYELLFRGINDTQIITADNKTFSSQVYINFCTAVNELSSEIQKPVFINMTTELIYSDDFPPVKPDSIYLEILEDQIITPEFEEDIKKWRALGYRFVLDNYKFNDERNELLPLISIVKVDVLATPATKFAREISALKRKGLVFIAENVATLPIFEVCKRLDFTLFQGSFLQLPEIIKDKKIDSNMHYSISLVNALQDEDISIEVVSTLVEKNPKLSLQLLKTLNNPAYGVPKEITSIKEAVIFIGLSKLKKWAILITLTSASTQPLSIFKMLLTRGHCCQLLAEKDKSSNSDAAFIVGVMSGIDILFNIEKSSALDELELSEDVLTAITEQSGKLGSYLTQTLNCENKNWEGLIAMDSKARKNLNKSFMNSIVWSEEALKSIN